MRTSLVVLLLCGSAVLAGDGAKSDGAAGGHPHFNDQGTMHWYTKLADAQAAAKKAGKLIFVEYGREA